jgi:hypothetical protein
VWTGREYLFLWRIFAGDGVFVRRIDGNGKLVGSEVRIHSYQNAFDLAWNGSRVGTVWVERVEGSLSVMFQAFDRLGNPLTDAVPVVSSPDITSDGSVVYGPRIAAAGGDFFVLWSGADTTSGGTSVYLVRVDPSGVPRFDPVRAGHYVGGDGPKLDLAWSGSEAMASWTTDTGGHSMESAVRVRPFSFAAEPLGDARSVVEGAPYGVTPQLLWAGSEFLELWSGAGAGRDDARVFASRRDAAGGEIATVTLAPPVVGHYRYLHPAVWARDRLAMLWTREGEPDSELSLSRFAPDGSLHGSPIVIPWTLRPGRLYLAWTGGEYGFIWSDEDASGYGYRVWFQRATFCD